VKVNLALGELPAPTTWDGPVPGDPHTGLIAVSPSVEYLERAWDEAKYGGVVGALHRGGIHHGVRAGADPGGKARRPVLGVSPAVQRQATRTKPKAKRVAPRTSGKQIAAFLAASHSSRTEGQMNSN
jgi:hypothetical protein